MSVLNPRHHADMKGRSVRPSTVRAERVRLNQGGYDSSDVGNRFVVGATAGGVVALCAPPLPRQALSRDDVLNLCAWASVVAGIEDDELAAARRQVEST